VQISLAILQEQEFFTEGREDSYVISLPRQLFTVGIQTRLLAAVPNHDDPHKSSKAHSAYLSIKLIDDHEVRLYLRRLRRDLACRMR
jgi:hypothetical protein